MVDQLQQADKVVIGGNWYALLNGCLMGGPVLESGALSLEDYGSVEGMSPEIERAWLMLAGVNAMEEGAGPALILTVRELANQLLTLRLERDARGETWNNTRTNEISAALLQARDVLRATGAPAGFLEGL